MFTFFLDNTNTFYCICKLIQDDGTYIFDNNSTVEITIEDQGGNALSGVTFPLSVPYVAASNGRYQVNVSHLLAGVDKEKYWVQLDIESGTGEKYSAREPLITVKRSM